tara:strand:- start:121 stop:513 length:393 start_codon:yes stop_codon:yes gene_type:complete
LFFSTAFPAGCGSHQPGSDKPRESITIAITYGGEPVTEGMVNLENTTTGEGGGGELDAQGVATIPNVVLGEYTVTIIPPDPDPVPPAPGQPAAKIKTYSNIPPEFRTSNKSTLKAEVKAGSNELKFDLKE